MACLRELGRAEPERLLPPVIELQKDGEVLDIEKYQNLVDTIHFDNQEGVSYLVKRVYAKDGIGVVDRILYNNSDKSTATNRNLDTVFLGDVINYPILQGRRNPKYAGGAVRYPRAGSQPGVRPTEEAQVAIPVNNHPNRAEGLASNQVAPSLQDSQSSDAVVTVDVRNRSKNRSRSLDSVDNSKSTSQNLPQVDGNKKFKFAKIVDRTSDMHVLPPQWVFALKKDSENRVKLYKSKLVIRGDRAVYEIDYFESFSPVAKMETIRITLALIILNKLKPLQVDVTTAYLQAELDDDVYMGSIPGWKLPYNKIWKLLKSLYGLPQAGRNWNKKFERFLILLGFINIREDRCIFILSINLNNIGGSRPIN